MLNAFLMYTKHSLILHNIVARALNVIERQRRDLQLGLLDKIGGHRAVVQGDFDERLDRIRAAQASTVSEIRNKVRTDLPARLSARYSRWCNDLRVLVTSAAHDAEMVRNESQRTDPLLNTLQNDLQATTDPIVRDWLRWRSAEVTEILIDLVSDRIGWLFELARSPGRIGAEIAGLALRADSVTDPGWAVADVPAVTVPHLSWTVPVDHGGWAHMRASSRQADQWQHILGAIDREIAVASQQTWRQFEQVADQWVQDLATQIEKSTVEEAARFQNNVSREPSAVDVSALDEVITRLGQFQIDIQAWEPHTATEPIASAVEMHSAPSETTNCVICIRLRDTLIKYLSHSQYQLATRNGDQVAHAQGHGFCPLHTWTYFTLASPLGISAGYAALADATARSLEAVCSLASDSGELAGLVAGLAATRECCPVCQKLSETEKDAIETYVAHEESRSRLCLGHLALVCAAEPSSGRAQSAIENLATELRRGAEDMRSYALKREARYRSLITSDEAQAYNHVLRLLAGEPELARPSSTEKDLDFPPDKN